MRISRMRKACLWFGIKDADFANACFMALLAAIAERVPHHHCAAERMPRKSSYKAPLTGAVLNTAKRLVQQGYEIKWTLRSG